MRLLRFAVDKNADETNLYLSSREQRGGRYLYFYIARQNIHFLPENQRLATTDYADAVETCHGYTIEAKWPQMPPGTEGLTQEDILRLTKLRATRTAALVVSGRIRAEDWDKYPSCDLNPINVYDPQGNVLLEKLAE